MNWIVNELTSNYATKSLSKCLDCYNEKSVWRWRTSTKCYCLILQSILLFVIAMNLIHRKIWFNRGNMGMLSQKISMLLFISNIIVKFLIVYLSQIMIVLLFRNSYFIRQFIMVIKTCLSSDLVYT